MGNLLKQMTRSLSTVVFTLVTTLNWRYTVDQAKVGQWIWILSPLHIRAYELDLNWSTLEIQKFKLNWPDRTISTIFLGKIVPLYSNCLVQKWLMNEVPFVTSGVNSCIKSLAIYEGSLLLLDSNAMQQCANSSQFLLH